MSVDIHEIFWHPWELLRGYDSRQEEPSTQRTLTEFLLDIGSDPEVRFSSVYEAAMDWARNAETNHRRGPCK